MTSYELLIAVVVGAMMGTTIFLLFVCRSIVEMERRIFVMVMELADALRTLRVTLSELPGANSHPSSSTSDHTKSRGETGTQG